MDRWIQDLRYAWRALRKSPGFTLVAVLSLALGMGANSTIFSVGSALLLQPVGAANPDRLVRLYYDRHSPFAWPDYVDIRESARTLAGVAAATRVDLGIAADDGLIQPVAGELVSGNYFGVLGVGAALGRTFVAEEAGVSTRHAVAVVSDAFWRGRLGADPAVLGRSLDLNGERYAVVGVAPEGFSGALFGAAPDVWLPMSEAPALRGADLTRRERGGWLYAIGRLAPGAGERAAEAELDVIAGRLAAAFPDVHEGMTIRLERARGVPAEVRLQVVLAIAFLLLVTGIVLVIACSNVANMLLARASARRREIAIRLAIGAGRGQLVRQLLVESAVLAAMAATLGLLIALWTTDLIRASIPAEVPIRFDFRPDLRVLGATALVALVTAIAFGLLPALRASRPDVLPVLREEDGGGGYRRSRLRGGLLSAQVALCVLLLALGGMFLRSLANARTLDPGFAWEEITDAHIDLSVGGYDEARGALFWDELLGRIGALPGVEAVSLARLTPLGFENMETTFTVDGAPDAGGTDTGRRGLQARFNIVGPDYLRTMRIPLVRGRDMRTRDLDAVIINETMARAGWPGADPLGQRIRDGERSYEVVGVMRDSKYTSLGESRQPFLYLPEGGHYGPIRTVHIRSMRAPADLGRAVRAEVAAIDPALGNVAVRPLEFDMRVAFWPAKAGAGLLGSFGVLALLLASVGIYGVTSYVVSQRTREIGIRGALGAGGAHTVRLVVGEAARHVVIGTVIGTAIGLGAGRLVSGLLYEVAPTDPLIYIGTVVVILSVALLAAVVPVLRAVRVDPLVALRRESV